MTKIEVTIGVTMLVEDRGPKNIDVALASLEEALVMVSGVQDTEIDDWDVIA